jgi:hypothetical protein
MKSEKAEREKENGNTAAHAVPVIRSPFFGRGAAAGGEGGSHDSTV